VIYLIGLYLSFFHIAQAAPFPGTSSSALTAPEKGFYFLYKGFLLKTGATKWVPEGDMSNKSSDIVRLTSPENKTGALSVFTEAVNKNISLELYSRKWMRDYSAYGLEVLSAKNFTLNNSPALVVDMLSRAKGKQVRQVIVRKEQRMAIMTCLDSKDSFTETLKSCNEIIKSFEWAENEKSGPSRSESK
jgi:hypothetical protein